MAKTDLTIKFPNKISRKHFMDWLGLKQTKLSYDGYMDDVEIEDMRTKNLSIIDWVVDSVDGVVVIRLGRFTDLRAINLS